MIEVDAGMEEQIYVNEKQKVHEDVYKSVDAHKNSTNTDVRASLRSENTTKGDHYHGARTRTDGKSPFHTQQ